MFEPHLSGFDQDRGRGSGGDSGSNLLEELDKLAPIQRFDAFPKVNYLRLWWLMNRFNPRTSVNRVEVVFSLLSSVLSYSCWSWYVHIQRSVADMQNDLGEFLYGAPDYSFTVDHAVEKDLQLNVDMTVAMPCHCEYLSIWMMIIELMCRPYD
jgi:hypothetical protein